MMRRRATGTDFSDIAAELDADEGVKSVSHAITFSEDLTTREDILAALADISAHVGRRLRRKGLAGRTLTLKVRYDDLSYRAAQTILPQPSDDEMAFAPHLEPLLDTLWRDGIKVRLLSVGLSGFDEEKGSGYEQGALFDAALFDGPSEDEPEVAAPLVENDEKRRNLLHATDALKDRFGEDAVHFGHHFHNKGNSTGSSSKNPADYR